MDEGKRGEQKSVGEGEQDAAADRHSATLLLSTMLRVLLLPLLPACLVSKRYRALVAAVRLLLDILFSETPFLLSHTHTNTLFDFRDQDRLNLLLRLLRFCKVTETNKKKGVNRVGKRRNGELRPVAVLKGFV